MQEFDLNIGAHVRFQDGKSGTLRKVVIDPHTKQVTDLVVAQGFLQRHEHVIPITCVEKATVEAIIVALRFQDLEKYPEYREVEFEEELLDWESYEGYAREHVRVWYPSVGIFERERPIVPVIRRTISKGIPTDDQVIGRASVVRNLNGVVGKIDHLLLNRGSWEITHLVVRRGLIPHYVVIPYAWVSAITPGKVLIRGSNSQLKEVSIARWQQGLSSTVGVVAGAEEYALDSNLAIAEDVIALLADDPRTALYAIEVVCEQGMITLLGDVGNVVAHAAAEEIAHQHARVKSVVNALEVHVLPDSVTAISSTFGQLMEYAFITPGAGANRDPKDY